MKRILAVLAVVSILGLGLAIPSHAASTAPGGFATYDVTKLVGLAVNARDGGRLGRILDLVIDSNGHVDYAIVTTPGADQFPGRVVVVPFSTLGISRSASGQMNVVFNEDKEVLYEGPEWAYTNLENPEQAADVDQYYGIQPYWTEESGK